MLNNHEQYMDRCKFANVLENGSVFQETSKIFLEDTN